MSFIFFLLLFIFNSFTKSAWRNGRSCSCISRKFTGYGRTI